MRQRYTFQCWNCPRTYTLLRDITTEQKLTVACPYCNAEAVVDLAPDSKNIKQVLKGDGQEQELLEERDLPAVLQTRQPD